MKVVLYARVSDPRDGRQHPEIQLSDLRQYAAQRTWTVVQEYMDRISGAKDSRPALNQLMADAKRGRFELVMVWKLDRLGRSLRHLVNTLAEFKALDISLVSLRESLDLTTPMGKAMFGMIGVMAEFERELIRERVSAGMRNAQSRGVQVGRPRLAVDDRINELRASGLSYRRIASELGVSLPTVWKRLSQTHRDRLAVTRGLETSVRDQSI
jgi:DNA invertase Pin-like site-specific DNA recombinase